MKKIIPVMTFFGFYLAYLAFDQFQTEAVSKPVDQNSSRVSIMTYNTENLFDTSDDPKKDDETYLPLYKKNKSVKKKCKKNKNPRWISECLKTNWTDNKLDMKMKRIAQVIKSYKENGPDLVVLQEVENLDVLKLMNKKYLGYPYVFLLEGPDKRGIDVGVLSRLKNTAPPELHIQKFQASPKFKKIKATRGILELKLQLPDQKNLTLYGLHLPSQGSPTEARKQGILKLEALAQKDPGFKIAAGDFNITAQEDQKKQLYSGLLSKRWKVSHLIGCEGCKGSNYYHHKRSWSFLDAILFSKDFGQSWGVDRTSIKIWNPLPLQKTHHGTPKKFYDGEHRNGVSDHFPVVAEIYKI